MTDQIISNGLATTIVLLRHTLAAAMVDATTVCRDLEDGKALKAQGLTEVTEP